MAATVRTLFKYIIGLLVALPGSASPSRAAEPSPAEPSPAASAPAETLTQTLSMSAFMARLRQDAALQGRFAQNPRAVLREFGIDPPPINLPDRLTDDQMQRLLNDWTAGLDSPARSPDDGQQIAPMPAPAPAPVYGPPPRPPAMTKPPPAPVYGPPPGLPRP